MKLKYLFNRSLSGQRTRARFAAMIRNASEFVAGMVTAFAIFAFAILAIILF